MGLDVYLYRYEDKDTTCALEDKFEKEIDDLWHTICAAEGEWDKLDKAEQDLRYETYKKEKARIALSMGLNDDGSDEERKKCIELDSAKYPEHMFKIGYFRSSYNGSGINNILRHYLGKDLYSIFDKKDSSDYVIKVDWKQSLGRCSKLKAEFDQKIKENGAYGILQVSFNPLKGPNKNITSEGEALQKFLDVKKDRDTLCHSFSNLAGTFFLDEPLRVAGIIHGVAPTFVRDGGAIPCSYVIFERDGDTLNWNLQALEIVEETCQWVLDTKEPNKFYLHWSA